MRPDQPSGVPVLSRTDWDRIRRSREALVEGGLLTAPPGRVGVPEHIERSWRRCVSSEVPVLPTRVDFAEPERTVLHRAAEPVMNRLADSLADVAVAMVLSDASGRIIARRAQVRTQRDVMDNAYAAEGFDFSEQSVGTNGIGTVLAERRPVLVRGPEHYNVLLEHLTCASTPIIEPATGKLVGTFSLACSVDDVHPLMGVLAGDVGRQIEARILDEAGERRRRFVQACLSLERTDTGALVVDQETVLANRIALAHVGPDLHPLLWQFLTEHAPRKQQQMTVPLSDGMYDAVVEPAHDAGKPAYSVTLLSRRPIGQVVLDAPSAPVPPLGDEPLHFDDRVARELQTAVQHGELVALTGSAGTGKLRTALRTLQLLDAADPAVVEPHLDPDWFAHARSAVEAGRGLVLRRVHLAPVPSVAQVQALAASGGPIALTVDLDEGDEAVLGLVRQVATTVQLPELSRCKAQIPALVRGIVTDLGEPASRTRFAPGVWDVLMAWHWPGNVAELDNTVTALARRANGGIVEVDDLPAELRAPRRSMSLLECAERKAVVDALRAAGGNRSRAAKALGIGRNTLYRKMREFGLQ